MQTLKKFYFGKSKVKPFVSTWKTDNLSTGSSTATQVKLPLVSTGSYNFVVDWGDGTQSTITAWNQAAVTHTYSVAGTYQITIKGKCIGWTFGSTGDRLKIISIQQWGILRFGTGIVDHFKLCSNLNLSAVSDTLKFVTGDNLVGSFGNTNTVINRINEWDVSKITSMSGTFANSTFNQNINSWNTSSVTNMSGMFSACPFNQPLSNWNTSNVTTFRSMFQNNSVFNQDIGSWNVSKCINYIIMFQNATAFNNGGNSNINNWQLNTVNSIDIANMFVGATGFNQNISSWNMSKVSNALSMLSGATAFNNGLASGVAGNMFWDLSSVGNVQSMFNGATSFNQNLGALNLLNCDIFTSMFQNASKFNNGGSADINNWALNTTGSILMNNMFFGASIFNQNIGSWNTSKVTSMTAMFASALAFDNGGSDSINNWNTANVTSMTSMFSNCAFNQPVGNWNVSKVTTTQDMFRRTLTVGSFNQNISSWNMSAVTNSSGMFANLLVFNNGLASGVAGDMLWNLSNVTNCNTMFFNATSFNQNLGIQNMSKNVSFSDIFNGANKFNNGGSTDINNWVLNTTGTLSLAGAFKNCTLFNQPLNNWNVSKVTSMNQTFNGAAAFDQNIGSWNVSSVTDFTNFMLGKTPATFSAANLDAIYNGWSSRPVKTPITISFGTAKHSTASSAGKDILIMTPNNWTIGDGGSTDGIANTYIGGIGSTINTPALLATKLGISTNRIENFSVTGSDVECIVIGGSYVLGSIGSGSNLNLKYFIDSDGLVSSLGYQSFYNTSVERVICPKATSIATAAFDQNLGLGQNKNALKLLYTPLVSSVGDTVANNGVFRSGNLGGGVIYLNLSLATANAGAEEGDVAYLRTGNTIRYVTNFTPPNAITNLSSGTIYNTAIQLNFTTPTAVNGIDFYEVYVNGKLNKEIKNSGEFITGLTPATNYNIRVVAVDMFYNKSEMSNTVNVSTTNTLLDTDANAYMINSNNGNWQPAINTLFSDLKAQGLYNKILAFYPFLGTTQAQHKWNAKNPLDTNAAFRLQFFGGGTHSNLGYQCNGTNAYANTFLTPSVVQNLNSNGMTLVCGTNNTVGTGSSGNSVEIGSYGGGVGSYLCVKRNNTSYGRDCVLNNESNYLTSIGVNEARGIYTGTKTTSVLHKLFRNGLLLGSGIGGGSFRAIPFFIGSLNNNGANYGLSTQRIQFTAIHEGLTDAEVVALHTIIDNFEAAIGRKTW
nr:BspA family leucine-rich repeat surface protein [uncultured Flavobacterium sp.]